jgi:hypothetical protein
MRQFRAGVNPAQRVSASLLIESLQEQCEEVRDLEKQLQAARDLRDDAIRDALTIVPMVRLVKVTHLSRERLYAINSRTNESTGTR